MRIPPIPRNATSGHWAAVLTAAAFLWAGSGQVRAAAIVTIDFENEPALSAAPNNFAAAGPAQTYSRPGVYAISGGVVLGDPTFLAAFPTFGTPPNAYGTTDIADPSLEPAMLLTFPMTIGVKSVTGVLFNGQPIPEMYTVRAFSGAKLVDSAAVTLPPANDLSDFYKFALSSNVGITQVEITTPNGDVNGWDFFADTIVASAAVPEPSSGVLVFGALAVCSAIARRRRAGR